MVCTELLSKDARKRARQGAPAKAVVARHRFDELHEEGRRLIRSWAERAAAEIYCPDRACFEPFIFGWIAINGWACCVTEEDRDSEYLDALLLDDELRRGFENLLATDLLTVARDFQSFWPIFSSKDLGYNIERAGSRDEIVARYKTFDPTPGNKPACAFRHSGLREEVPLDWSHTLSAIYQVRCNLFHGYKGLHSENDVLIVSKAFRVLVRLLPMLIPNVNLPPSP